jgi:NAD(P)-dependent dehydrogenase (short-subunit alcohol dehydrogenase family)
MTLSSGAVLARPAVDVPADGALRPTTRLLWQPVPAPPLPAAEPARLHGRRIAVVGGSEVSWRRVADALSAQGAAPRRFDPPDAGLEESAAAFAADAVDGIVDLNVEARFDLSGRAAWAPSLRRSVALLKAVYAEWGGEDDTGRTFYMAVTRMGGLMGYDGDVPQPLGGIWAGLAKSLPQELPNCNVRVLDLGPEEEARLGELVAAELYRWGLFEIGYRRGVRYTLGARRVECGPAVVELGPADTVLVSGGGRGIGLEIARALAREHGSRVVVTGRGRLPEGNEPWLEMDEAALKRFADERYRAAGEGKSVAAVRREMAGIRRQRELHQQMGQVAALGLPIEYRPCDFTSTEQVRALIESIGPRLSGVIHNAGVDAPVRLPGKSLDAFVEIVATKVDGFTNIVRALDGRGLKFLCNVGSLVGRWGGMTGETDYAAANEALARLGLWAAGRLDTPVKTLCWPTWDRVGMITNFDVAVQYTSAMDVAEGVRRWRQELLAGDSGEITFMGPVGRALTPSRLHGFPPIPDLANIEELYSQYHYLGEVGSFEPFRRVRSTNRIDAAFAPCLHDVLVEGRPSLPASLLIEYGLAAGGWVTPDPRAALRLHELRDVLIRPAALALDGDTFVLERDAAGRWEGADWLVEVRLTRLTDAERLDVGRLALLYRREAPPPGALVGDRLGADSRSVEWRPPPSAGWRWNGLLFRPASWRRRGDGALVGEVRPSEAADLWSTPYTPASTLPANHLENALRGALALSGVSGRPAELLVERLRLFDGGASPAWLVGEANGTAWSVVDADGRTSLEVVGLAYR